MLSHSITYLILFRHWFTYLSDQLELELDAMRCSISLSSSKCLQPFQVGHLMLYPPTNQCKYGPWNWICKFSSPFGPRGARSCWIHMFFVLLISASILLVLWTFHKCTFQSERYVGKVRLLIMVMLDILIM